MVRRRSIPLAAALLLAACQWSAPPGGKPLDDGAILYKPRKDPGIHPRFGAGGYIDDWDIVDDKTGYHLRSVFFYGLKGENGLYRQWRLDKGWEDPRPIYFLTRDYQEKAPGTLPWDETVEILHALPDTFFPLKDALYPPALPFERIAGMLDVYGLKQGRHERYYLDNRVANRPRLEAWAKEREASPFLLPNYERYQPLDVAGAQIYFPAAGSAAYDSATKTAVAPDGSRLHSDNRNWDIFIDRDGRKDRIIATWSDASGRQQARIVMRPWRGYRKGYGETRTVEIITEHRKPGEAEPPGKLLADLINMSVPIAGDHAGHMIVIDNRAYSGEWR